MNLAGACLLGWAVTRLAPASYGRPVRRHRRVRGADDVRDAVQLELLRMLDGGRWALALAYAAASLAGGIAAVRIGIGLARGGRVRA